MTMTALLVFALFLSATQFIVMTAAAVIAASLIRSAIRLAAKVVEDVIEAARAPLATPRPVVAMATR
jgi:hypothetical protein